MIIYKTTKEIYAPFITAAIPWAYFLKIIVGEGLLTHSELGRVNFINRP